MTVTAIIGPLVAGRFSAGSLLAVSVPVRSVPDLIWAGSGAIFAAALVISIDSVLTHAVAYRRRSEPGRSWDGAMAAVTGLVEGDPEKSEGFSVLLRHPSSREIAIDALTNQGRANPEVMRCLRGRSADVESLSNWVTDTLVDKDPGRRAYACEVAAMTRMRSARGRMLATASDADPTVRIAACRALAVIDPEATVGVLLGVLDTEGPWAAALLGDVIARLPSDAVDALVRRANEWSASPALIRLLATARSDGANNVLLGTLDEVDADLRARSAEAIDARVPEARYALTALLTNDDEATRLGAVRSLGRSGDPDTALALFAALNDESRVVRLAAADAIAQLPNGTELLRRAAASRTDMLAAEAAELALWRAEMPPPLTTSLTASPIIGQMDSPIDNPAVPPLEELVEAALMESALVESALVEAAGTNAAPVARQAASRQRSPRRTTQIDPLLTVDGRPRQRAPKAPKGQGRRWLLDELVRRGGRVEASVIRNVAREAGISSSNLDRARREIADIDGFGAKAVWVLRSDALSSVGSDDELLSTTGVASTAGE